MPFVRSTDGLRVHYSVTGRHNGPPVILIQGLAADKHGWNPQRLALAPHYRTIALDNRGTGRTDKPYGDYALPQMAQDVLAVLDHAEVDDAHFIGASMGGILTQLIAVQHPERVRSMTLACTASRHHPWRTELLTEWANIARTDGMGAMTKAAARWVIGPRSFRRISPAIGWLGPLALSWPPHAFCGQVGAILNIDDDVSEQLRALDIPTMVIVGNQDILTPRGDSEELAEMIPGAELVVISGAAHGFMIEHARPFNREMLRFLKQAEATYQTRQSDTGNAALAERHA